MREELETIQKEMKQILDDERYQHTLGVMYTAASLAMAYGYPMEKAMMAGLLHDCAKGISNEEKIEECNRYGISIDPVEVKSPFLLHAKLGAYYAENKYSITDSDILHSILVHTTGCPEMNMLDKIIYISDFIEPNRDQAPNLTEIRKKAFTNLDSALLQILRDTLSYLNSKDFAVCDKTETTYRYYQKENNR